MAISSERYVSISSVVGGAKSVSTKELMLRIYTKNQIIPPNSVVELERSDIDEVSWMFGQTAVETKMADYYFGFISKVATKPNKIQFSRYSDADCNAMIYTKNSLGIDDIKKITAGKIEFILGGASKKVSGINLGTTADKTAVASTLQTAISAIVSGATVQYSSWRDDFTIDFGSTNGSKKTISIKIGTDTDEATLKALGLKEDAIFSDGIEKQTITDCLTKTEEVNNNFGSYVFAPKVDAQGTETYLTKAEVIDSAKWCAGMDIEYVYSEVVTSSNKDDYSTALSSIASTCLTYNTVQGEYPHLLPCAIMASQNFTQPNATVNYMFQIDGRLTPSVVDNATANELDKLKINYYGSSQEAGTPINFYQKGQLCGDQKYPKYLGVHADEQWLKAELKAKFLNMFTSLQQVPADARGITIGSTYLNSVVEQAKSNGVISVGKPLTTEQISYITQVTGDSKAYLEITGRGYWYSIDINPTDNVMDYLLLYSKADAINKVEGRHVLI